jgi:hypothetical protein
MKFYCNRCHQAFTTFRKSGTQDEQKERSFAFSHLLVNKMSCPNCGATNRGALSVASERYSKHYRTRYQPRPRAATGEEDYIPPNIILHPDCQKRVCGSSMNVGGLQVICEGCPQVFNCWTGNVDDGLCNEAHVPEKPVIIKTAQERLIETNRQLELANLNHLREKLGKEKFGYERKNNQWYCRYAGTIWKLSDDDVASIKSGEFGTPVTKVIKQTLDKHSISLAQAKLLLGWERHFMGLD